MKLLVVDDDKITRDLIKEVFEKEGYEVVCVGSAEEGLKHLAQESIPLILSDIRMRALSGLDLLTRLKSLGSRSIVILMTGFGNMEGAIEAIHEGAFDYISKPFSIQDLRAVVSRAAEHWKTLESWKEAPDAVGDLATLPQKTIIGKSSQIVEVYKTLARATMSESNVLITGESGTGKELVAKAIHEHGPRRDKPWLAVNCGALAENLLESELFGHVKGAFTGAIAHKRGLFEEANGGTIFLDEIGDVSPALQVKLLRILQEGELKAVGSTETRRVNVRVIAATRVDLEGAIRAGKFREDLYYRLKVISITLPPLRERLGDLPELINYFLVKFSSKIGKRISHVSNEAMVVLERYAWPGNIRELEHAIERAVAMTRTSVLHPEDFPAEIGHPLGSAPAATSVPTNSLEEVERNHILKVLQDTQYNKSKAAAILGIDRKTLHRKAQRYEIKLGSKD